MTKKLEKSNFSIQWNNEDNAAYYENTPIEVFQAYATRGGLSDFSDLQLIQEYILTSVSLMEIGAGYGRVVDYLFQNGFLGEIIAVERSKQFFQLLAEKYKDAPVSLVNIDVKRLLLQRQVKLILWLWSGISDFPREEQCTVIDNLSHHLAPEGILILETFSYAEHPINAEASQNQSYIIRDNNTVLRGYIPSPEEITEYAQQCKFKAVNHIPYFTSASRPRSLFILSK